MRRLVANLDCEAHWALEAMGLKQMPKGLSGPDWSRLGPMAALMALVGESGDEVLVPRSDELQWGELGQGLSIGWADPQGAKPATSVYWAESDAAEWNDRTLALSWRRERDSKEESRYLLGLDDLLVAVRREKKPWVAKARFSAAGRWRQRGEPGALSPERRTRIERLLAISKGLIFEPWEEVEREWGFAAWLDPKTGLRGAPHRTTRFGDDLVIEPVIAAQDAIEEEALERLMADVAFVARKLAAEKGKSGPFGIDLRLSRAGGWRSLGDVNVRFTLGHMAHLGCHRFSARSLRIGPGKGGRIFAENSRVSVRFE